MAGAGGGRPRAIPAQPVACRVPTRICDLGGWTDTWFARHGAVCHLAVWPGIEVEVARLGGPSGVDVHVGAFDRTWTWHPRGEPTDFPDPLLAATLDEACPPADTRLSLTVRAGVPPGASMGTSASTCVAVLTAIDAWQGVTRPVETQVRRAHHVETGRLGWQSGVQDQWAAAPGAAHLIEMSAYPEATCRAIPLPAGVTAALNDTLLVVWLGRGHLSTAVHEWVVDALRTSGPDDRRLAALRQVALDGAQALAAGDLEAYGQCLVANTAWQRALHPALVGDDAARVIAQATAAGARGWKVNGAGGDGGTVTVLCRDAAQRETLAGVVCRTLPGARVLPVELMPSA